MPLESDDECEPKKPLSEGEQEKPARQGILENFSFLKEMIKFNEENNEIRAADQDWLIIRADLLRELFEGLRTFLGRGADIAIRAAGKTSGRRFVDILLKRGMVLDEAQMILGLLLNEGGWGKTEIEIDTSAKTARITIQNCVSARGVKSSEPSCQFLAGYYEGFFEKLFNTKISCVETTCKAAGDALCEFQAKAD